jgi:hypothetical protein
VLKDPQSPECIYVKAVRKFRIDTTTIKFISKIFSGTEIVHVRRSWLGILFNFFNAGSAQFSIAV